MVNDLILKIIRAVTDTNRAPQKNVIIICRIQ